MFKIIKIDRERGCLLDLLLDQSLLILHHRFLSFKHILGVWYVRMRKHNRPCIYH